MAVPMAKEIRRRGYGLILSDMNPDCEVRKLELEDSFYRLDVYDIEEHLKMASIHNSPAAVLCIGCDAAPTVSALSEFFGLPGIGRAKAERAKDKAQMRQTLDLAHPDYAIVDKTKGEDNPATRGLFKTDRYGVLERSTEDREEGYRIPIIEEKDFPVVIKAPDQAGSRGVSVAYDMDQFLTQIVQNPSQILVIEEMLQGEDIIPGWREKYGFDTSEAAFDFFVEEGEVIPANGALRMFWCDQPTIEAGHINPFDADSEVIALAQQAADGLEIDWGVLKIDLKKDKRYGWCLLEVATRLSGGFDHMYTAPLATGRDITGVMLDVALGRKVDREKLAKQKNKVACCYAPRWPPGPVLTWQREPSIYDYSFTLAKKDIRPLTCNQDRSVFLITSGDTYVEALHKAIFCADNVYPEYEKEEFDIS
jgi:biotin carboxylase